ncbi:hypothetical protein ACROYT_G031222 [Oculina patagonica]
MRFLRERIRLTQMAKGDSKKDADSTAQSITSALSTEDAERILEQIKINTRRVFYATKDRQKQKFEKLVPQQRRDSSLAERIELTDVPLRHIVSCVNTFAYGLSAYLSNILSPLTRNWDFAVTNSAHFVSTISSETILDNEIMVSFDVESLFTNVPIDDAVQAALRKLENDPSFADRTTLTPALMADLLNFVLRSTYFQYYEQREGAAMESPVSAVVSNLCMKSFEEQKIT